MYDRLIIYNQPAIFECEADLNLYFCESRYPISSDTVLVKEKKNIFHAFARKGQIVNFLL